jgi:hypothetical protein
MRRLSSTGLDDLRRSRPRRSCCPRVGRCHKRVKELAAENARLKRLLAEAAPEKDTLQPVSLIHGQYQVMSLMA